MNTKRGFTLIEILVVIGLIAILASIVLIAINPARQFAQARNTQRTGNIETILNAIGQRVADNKGVFGGTCPTISTNATSSIDNGAGGSGVDFATNCLTPTYISTLPIDPAGATAPSTGYTAKQDATTGRIMVCAPLAAGETVISNPPPSMCITR